MREIRAGVLREKGGPFRIENLLLGEPRPEEVLVRVVATGMCHTDMVARDQLYDVPLPIVLGHEGAGIVEQIGESVKKVAVCGKAPPASLWCRHRKTGLRRGPTRCRELFRL